MIDDEAVENVAFEYSEGIGFEAFIDGTKWATFPNADYIEEF